MPRIDFYVLPDDASIDPAQYACRLISKVYRLGHKIYVHCSDAHACEALNDQLWQQDADSFIPHDLAHQAGTASPIILGWQQPPTQCDAILVNLAGDVPTFHTRFQRVAEIVPGNPAARKQSRINFRFYQEKGYALQTHRIPSMAR